MTRARVALPTSSIEAFCKKWKISELSLFGSVLRDDFRPESDIDVMVAFAKDAEWSLFDFVDMQDELKAIFGREVDLVEKTSINNPYRRYEILSTKEVVYAR